MLVKKAWLETRWRLTAMYVYSILFLSIHCYYQHPGMKLSDTLVPPWMILTFGVLTLAGGGVKTQSPIGFPEGLAESTQFTLALPVSRRRLMTVRVAVGLLEAASVTLIVASLTWALFPTLRAVTTPADFVRGVLTTLLWLAGPFCSAMLFESLMPEPLSMVIAGWTFALLLWLLHRVGPAVDVIRAFGQASPLITHQMPWSQMATSIGLSLILFFAAAWVGQTREY